MLLYFILIFINDLPESVKNSFAGIFCDDTLLAKEINNESDALELQNDLDNVFEWTKLWNMKFNTLKCVHMTVTNKRKPFDNKYHLDGKILKTEESAKYLGVTIDRKLTFETHIKDKCRSATKILNMLKRNLYFAPKSVKTKAYQACVVPILEYASTCWSPTSEKLNNMIEMVQNNAARFISNAYRKKGHFEKISITKILNDLKFDSLEERRRQARLTMAYKILNGYVILNRNLLPKFRNYGPTRQCNTANVGFRNQLIEPTSRLKVTEHTFFYSVQKSWNQTVFPKQANAPSVEAFKSHFQNK